MVFGLKSQLKVSWRQLFVRTISLCNIVTSGFGGKVQILLKAQNVDNLLSIIIILNYFNNKEIYIDLNLSNSPFILVTREWFWLSDMIATQKLQSRAIPAVVEVVNHIEHYGHEKLASK